MSELKNMPGELTLFYKDDGSGFTFLNDRLRSRTPVDFIRADLAERDGWKLVPIEPTEKMSNVGKYVLKGAADDDERTQAESVYRAMLAATDEAEDV